MYDRMKLIFWIFPEIALYKLMWLETLMKCECLYLQLNRRFVMWARRSITGGFYNKYKLLFKQSPNVAAAKAYREKKDGESNKRREKKHSMLFFSHRWQQNTKWQTHERGKQRNRPFGGSEFLFFLYAYTIFTVETFTNDAEASLTLINKE